MKKIIPFLMSCIFWLFLFQALSMMIDRAYILPSPSQIFQAWVLLVQTREFYFSVLATMSRVVLGILLCFIFGTLSVFCAYLFPIVRRQLDGLAAILKSTPVMAVILYVVLWMPSSKVPIFVCFLMCYPVVYTNMLSGLDSINQDYLEMCKVYHVGWKQKMIKFYYPGIKPHIRSALSLISGLSWKTVVAGEVISIPHYSVGYHLMDSKIYFETAEMFAWITTIVVLSVCFEKVIKVILRWI